MLVTSVGKSNEELATGEGVEVLGSVALYPILFPNGTLFTLSIDLGDDLVKITGGVHVLPKRLAVCRVVATRVILLSTVVNEWDTETSQRENSSSAETLLVATVVAHEARVVVVINEKTEDAQVLEVALLSSVSILNIAHVHSRAENIGNSVVHRVVK